MKIQSQRSSYTLIPELGILINSEIDGEILSFYADQLEINEEEIVENLRAQLTDEEIEQKISRCRSLTLCVTDECNFRCTYCAFSGVYEYNRMHRVKSMSFDTAKKAVDLYFKTLIKKIRNVKYDSVYIGFYGGEALLEFDLVRDIIYYAKQKIIEDQINKQCDIVFRISTNGYLLGSNEIVDFLISNDVGLDISLDGPKEEHDKFRLTAQSEATWDVIWKNLDNIYNRDSDYFNRNITFLATLHPFHDYKKIDRFFIEHSERFNIDRLLISNVRKNFLKKPLKEKWFSKEINQSSQLKNIKSFSRFDGKFNLKKISKDSHFTGMCFPGEIKYHITTDGDIYICERIKLDAPIGHVDTGFNFNAIREMYRLWNEEIIKYRCWECPAVAFCSTCIAHSEYEDRIQLNCTYKDRYEDILANFLNFKEDEYLKKRGALDGTEISAKHYLQSL